MPTRTVAYVRWFDSAFDRSEAVPPEELTGAYMENESAGLLVHEDARSITLALDRCLETQNLRLLLTIPKVNIRRIRKARV